MFDRLWIPLLGDLIDDDFVTWHIRYLLTMVSSRLVSATQHRKRKGRTRIEKDNDIVVVQGRSSIPCRSYRKVPATGQVRNTNGCRSPRLPRRRSGIPLCRDFGARRKRRSRQQKEPHYPPSHHSSREERRRVEQTPRKRYHCRRWCLAQHSRRVVAQEGQGWQVQFARVLIT